jgi:hypothetical protein
MNGKMKLFVMASVVALCMGLGPATGSANAQNYYNGRPTFVDRLFGYGYNNYGNYNLGNYGFNRGFGGMGYHCGGNGWGNGNGNGWGGGWGNCWHHHHHRHFW